MTMTSDGLRDEFLRYFKGLNHTIRPSASLVPTTDRTLLFTSAGMVPFKPYFLGEERPFSRAASCQRCFRTSDIDKVGKTRRHHTFFEMLGNFSFGDYFKEEAIDWAFKFLTKELGLTSFNLWISVYKDDDETVKLWLKQGVSPERIVRRGENDNFWKMGETGPCGPSSEIIIDQGEGIGCGSADCSVECSCDRFLELWNLVFTQFDRRLDGTLLPLPRPNIDTGMGLERLACIMQGKRSNFETDLLWPIIERSCDILNLEYGADRKKDSALRIIADHIRSLVFLSYDRVYPENVGRGYVWRNVLRRASWQARHHLKIEGPFLYQLVPTVVRIFRSVEGLEREREYIARIIHIEEERFLTTLELGEPILKDKITSTIRRGERVLQAKDLFELYDTHGLPLELIEELGRERGILIDLDGFRREMASQKERSRRLSCFKPRVNSTSYQTEFVGYVLDKIQAKILAIIKDGAISKKAKEGEEIEIVLDKTPFYPEQGGQVGDTGVMSRDGFKAEVVNTYFGSYGHLHKTRILEGEVLIGDTILASIDRLRRKEIERNHTATHLLHATLRKVLGDHVRQSGSLVTQEGLRFDFTHLAPLEEREIKRIQELVNNRILEDLEVSTYETTLMEAREKGAIALFEQDYKDLVRCVKIGEISLELCGGTHLRRTGEIGLFRLISERGIASGIRRIEAITGLTAYRYVEKEEEMIDELRSLLKVSREDLIKKVCDLLIKNKEFEKKVKRLNLELIRSRIEGFIKETSIYNGVKILFRKLEGLELVSLRDVADIAILNLKSGVVVLATVDNKKINLVSKVSKDLTPTIHAGRLINEIAKVIGGGGGGRPDFGEGGGVRKELLDEAFKKGLEMIKDAIHPPLP